MIARFVCAVVVVFLSLCPVVAQPQPPASITPDAVKKTKRATVYFKVTDHKGRTGEGSGFLALESGIVVTNAHVLGMIAPSAKEPRKIEIAIHSGEKDEILTTGKVLGVDRVADLAVIQLDEKSLKDKTLPAPLQLGLTHELFETQKVYIFGFPFGAELGKNVTVSDSSISSLRRNGSGALSSIQVNGGMNPGNSGGPVVNSLGEVIGVSVSGILSTQINFAIPAANVQNLLAGGIQESRPGELFRSGDEIRVPISYKTLDPFKKIREIRVEVWAGKPHAKRPFSTTKADPQPDDGPRTSHVLKNAGGDVPLPKIGEGQVVWVQPVLVFEKGEAWGTPQSFEPALAVERSAAELICKLADQKERTVHLKTSQTIHLSRGKTKFVSGDGAELDILEAFDAHEQGARVRTAFGSLTLTSEEGGKKLNPGPQVAGTLVRIPPTFIVDETNKLRSRVDVNLNPKFSPIVREQVGEYYTQICNAYEACNFVIPNRSLDARETWDVRLPLLLKLRGKGEVVDLVLVCTYEGARQRDGNSEALVRVAGKVKGRNAATAKVDGQVEGKFTYDVRKKFVSSVKLKIFNESADDEIQALFSFDIDLTRREGNPLKLELPAERPSPGPVPGPSPKLGTEVLVQSNGNLTAKDPPDRTLAERGSRARTVPLQMAAGKTYSITLNSSAFDAYLRVLDPAGKVVAEDDDGGGGTNARLNFSAKTTGLHAIVVTSFDGKLGAYELKVIGEPAMLLAANAPAAAGAGKDAFLRGEGFAKPAASAAPTNYLKIVSSPGDYIGQGKTYEYPGIQLNVRKNNRGVTVGVDGWGLEILAPNGQFLAPGEYHNAKRAAFSGDSPGLNFSGKGRGSNTLSGEFVVWELEVDGDRVVRAAIDFVQRSEGRGPPLRGKLRVNSTFE